MRDNYSLQSSLSASSYCLICSYIKMANARDVSGMMRRLTESLLDDQLSSLQDLWKNKTLQVATVCSGTDAPILALEMLLPILKQKESTILPWSTCLAANPCRTNETLFRARPTPRSFSIMSRNCHLAGANVMMESREMFPMTFMCSLQEQSVSTFQACPPRQRDCTTRDAVAPPLWLPSN